MALKLSKNLETAFKELTLARDHHHTNKPPRYNERFNNFIYWAIYDFVHAPYNRAWYNLRRVETALAEYLDEDDEYDEEE